jgi:transposase-like protein
MFDANDDAKGEFRRVEVLTGPSRRRRWSAEEKARIVEETLAPDPRVRGGSALAGLFAAGIRLATGGL